MIKVTLLTITFIVLLSGLSILACSNTDLQTGGGSGIATYPENTGYVTDKADVLSTEFEVNLVAKLEGVHEMVQVAVVTVNTTSPLTVEEYTIELAEKWGVGDVEKDNGIVFLLAVEDRKTRIEVGTGMEGIINDAKAGRILDDYVLSYFKDDNWEGGINSGVDAIIKEVQNE